MTCKFGRITINGNDETVLNTVKTWLETKIDKAELNDKIGDGKVSVSEDIDGGTFTLNCDMYLLESAHVTKYKTFIVDKFKTFDKSTFNFAEMIKYNECSHDEASPKPCAPIVILRWDK